MLLFNGLVQSLLVCTSKTLTIQATLRRVLGESFDKYISPMNYLAHVLLSKNTIDYQLGNLLADPLKGRAWEGCTNHHRDGLKMHGKIDTFTDTHAHVKNAKSKLGERGYLKGVVIDIVFDHLIHKYWDNFVAISIDQFLLEFHTHSRAQLETLPSRASGFVEGIITHNVLASYGQITGLATAFKRVDRRLPPRILEKESTSDYLPKVEAHLSAIEEDFCQFFPELIEHFLVQSQASANEHIFK